MQQHAESVGGAQTAGARRLEQRRSRAARRRDRRRSASAGRSRRRGRERRLFLHAERRGVDQEPGAGKRGGHSSQRAGCTAAPNTWRNASARSSVRLTTTMRPMPRARRPWTTARAAPPAPSTTTCFRLAIPARRADVEIGQKSFDIGVGRAQDAMPSSHNVLAAPTARARSSGSDSASAASLCGTVTLAPT